MAPRFGAFGRRHDLAFTVGQPPGPRGLLRRPLYVDEELLAPGATVSVPEDGHRLVQFPPDAPRDGRPPTT